MPPLRSVAVSASSERPASAISELPVDDVRDALAVEQFRVARHLTELVGEQLLRGALGQGTPR